jgi:hypothetical protein
MQKFILFLPKSPKSKTQTPTQSNFSYTDQHSLSPAIFIQKGEADLRRNVAALKLLCAGVAAWNSSFHFGNQQGPIAVLSPFSCCSGKERKTAIMTVKISCARTGSIRFFCR